MVLLRPRGPPAWTDYTGLKTLYGLSKAKKTTSLDGLQCPEDLIWANENQKDLIRP
jgi:hypothetical protein